MQKRWIPPLMIALLVLSVPLLMGVKCNPNQPDATLEEEAQQQGTPTAFTKESLEKAGVPVYPSTDDGLVQMVTVTKNGEHHGSVVLHSSTCPPENVEKFYDSVLSGKPGYRKDIGNDNVAYVFTGENGDTVAILINSGGEGPMGGSNITVLFNP